MDDGFKLKESRFRLKNKFFTVADFLDLYSFQAAPVYLCWAGFGVFNCV